jgi:hypothetical protein
VTVEVVFSYTLEHITANGDSEEAARAVCEAVQFSERLTSEDTVRVIAEVKQTDRDLLRNVEAILTERRLTEMEQRVLARLAHQAETDEGGSC